MTAQQLEQAQRLISRDFLYPFVAFIRISSQSLLCGLIVETLGELIELARSAPESKPALRLDSRDTPSIIQLLDFDPESKPALRLDSRDRINRAAQGRQDAESKPALRLDSRDLLRFLNAGGRWRGVKACSAA